MWGKKRATPEGVARLTQAFVAEWTYAVEQMLRHWDEPPSR